MSNDLQLTAADGFRLDAYLAQPAGAPRGGLIVLQEIFGVNSHIRSVADRYAAEGYLVIAPALFDRAEPGVNLGYTPEDMKAAVAHIQKHEKAPAVAYQDLLWTLINCKEFVFNK